METGTSYHGWKLLLSKHTIRVSPTITAIQSGTFYCKKKLFVLAYCADSPGLQLSFLIGMANWIRDAGLP